MSALDRQLVDRVFDSVARRIKTIARSRRHGLNGGEAHSNDERENHCVFDGGRSVFVEKQSTNRFLPVWNHLEALNALPANRTNLITCFLWATLKRTRRKFTIKPRSVSGVVSHPVSGFLWHGWLRTVLIVTKRLG